MQIRKATLRNADELTKLLIEFKESLTKYEPQDLKKFRLEEKSKSKIKKSVIKELKNKKGLFLIAEQNNQIVGFIYGALENYHHMVFKTIKRGNINHIWVKEEFRKKGIATKLKDAILDWFKKNKCEYAGLLVLNLNPATDSYEKWGFEEVLETMVKRL